jgi:hypothetical protein
MNLSELTIDNPAYRQRTPPSAARVTQAVTAARVCHAPQAPNGATVHTNDTDFARFQDVK